MKKLIVLCLLLAGCATGPDRFQQEYDAYVVYLKAEVSAGRITEEQAVYLAYSKANTLTHMRDTSTASGLGAAALGLSIMQANQPYVPPSLNCYSVRQGVFTNISCR